MSNYFDNLPAGLPSDFLDEECPKMKVCPECTGHGADSKDGMTIIKCEKCNGAGEIEMTAEELQEEKEERNEPDDL